MHDNLSRVGCGDWTKLELSYYKADRALHTDYRLSLRANERAHLRRKCAHTSIVRLETRDVSDEPLQPKRQRRSGTGQGSSRSLRRTQGRTLALCMPSRRRDAPLPPIPCSDWRGRASAPPTCGGGGSPD